MARWGGDTSAIFIEIYRDSVFFWNRRGPQGMLTPSDNCQIAPITLTFHKIIKKKIHFHPPPQDSSFNPPGFSEFSTRALYCLMTRLFRDRGGVIDIIKWYWHYAIIGGEGWYFKRVIHFPPLDRVDFGSYCLFLFHIFSNFTPSDG